MQMQRSPTNRHKPAFKFTPPLWNLRPVCTANSAVVEYSVFCCLPYLASLACSFISQKRLQTGQLQGYSNDRDLA